MNTLVQEDRIAWKPVHICGTAGRASQECLSYSEMLLAVASRMTGDAESAKTLFRAVIRRYLARTDEPAPKQTVKFQLLTLLRQLYLEGAHQAVPPS